jgi:hypothetical protein
MKAIKILGFSIISLIFVCGCAGNNPPVQKYSDDELYLQSLNDFAALSDTAQPQAGTQSAQEHAIAAELKNRSTLFYTKVAPLNVSSKFEHSKTSFLQALQEGDAVADFYLSSPPDGQDKSFKGRALTAAQHTDANTHNQNFLVSLITAYDPDVCSAANETYSNITAACKSYYNTQFFRFYQIL